MKDETYKSWIFSLYYTIWSEVICPNFRRVSIKSFSPYHIGPYSIPIFLSYTSVLNDSGDKILNYMVILHGIRHHISFH